MKKGPVVQLNRTRHSGCRDRGFESPLGHHKYNMHEIEEILLDLQTMGFSSSAIERALDLNQGDLQYAILTDNPETITLLRIIKTFPWILEVAEHNYMENSSQRILLHNAVDIIMNEQYNEKLKGNKK